MSLVLNRNLAERAFLQAISRAESDEVLPQEWLERAREVGGSPSRSFVAIYATGLLARAVDERADPCALKSSAVASRGLLAFAARGLATNVVVPLSVDAGINLGVTGREPHNNSPFYKQDRVHAGLVVRNETIPHLAYLVDSLTRAGGLTRQDAGTALAALLRVRRRRSVKTSSIVNDGLSWIQLVEVAQQFVKSPSQRGRRGQALTAAALDLIFPFVQSGAIHDPSRHWPGDVRAGLSEGVAPSLLAEVKQKPVDDVDVKLFVAAAAKAGMHKALYLAFDIAPRSPDALRQWALREYDVLLYVLTDIRQLLHWVAFSSSESSSELARRLPSLVATRLHQIEAGADAIDDWRSYLQRSAA
jgi:SacI restriction endonuclease